MRNLLEVRNISKTFKANKIEIEVLKDKKIVFFTNGEL